jgi:hypothetical protein
VREIPFLSIGNVAVGVIAIGNVARGVVAIGFSVSIGVVAIGMNAVGAVAIGLNAAGPVSIAAINGVGTVSIAGVNAIGGIGRGFVNSGMLPAIGLALAAIAIAVGHVGARGKRRRAEVRGDLGVAELLTCAPGEYGVPATVRDGALEHGGGRCAFDGAPEELPAIPAFFRVRVADRFDGDGDYREAAQLRRRITVLSWEPLFAPPLIATASDLAWVLGRGLQLSAVAAAVTVLAARYL